MKKRKNRNVELGVTEIKKKITRKPRNMNWIVKEIS